MPSLSKRALSGFRPKFLVPTYKSSHDHDKFSDHTANLYQNHTSREPFIADGIRKYNLFYARISRVHNQKYAIFPPHSLMASVLKHPNVK